MLSEFISLSEVAHSDSLASESLANKLKQVVLNLLSSEGGNDPLVVLFLNLSIFYYRNYTLNVTSQNDNTANFLVYYYN